MILIYWWTTPQISLSFSDLTLAVPFEPTALMQAGMDHWMLGFPIQLNETLQLRKIRKSAPANFDTLFSTAPVFQVKCTKQISVKIGQFRSPVLHVFTGYYPPINMCFDVSYSSPNARFSLTISVTGYVHILLLQIISNCCLTLQRIIFGSSNRVCVMVVDNQSP